MPAAAAKSCSSSSEVSLTRWDHRRPRNHHSGSSISTAIAPSEHTPWRGTRTLASVSSPEAALRRCWHGLGGDDGAVLDDLLARHREPHRRYHTAVHVMWVLRHVDELLTEEIDAPAVRAAALFHDAVYDPRS